MSRVMCRRLFPYLLAAILVAAGWSVLGQYSVTWDEALGDLFFGERNLSFLTTLDAKYLDFDSNPYPAGHRPDLMRSAFRTLPWEYPPASATLAFFSTESSNSVDRRSRRLLRRCCCFCRRESLPT